MARRRPPALNALLPRARERTGVDMQQRSVCCDIPLSEARVVDALSYVGDATRRPSARGARLRLWTLQEPQVERQKYQDNSDVHDQPSPEMVLEQQDVHADHDGYHREHVKRDG